MIHLKEAFDPISEKEVKYHFDRDEVLFKALDEMAELDNRPFEAVCERFVRRINADGIHSAFYDQNKGLELWFLKNESLRIEFQNGLMVVVGDEEFPSDDLPSGVDVFMDVVLDLFQSMSED